jgi:putative sterol carrier protein
MPDLFTHDGIVAWQAHLNTSRQFLEAAGTWEGALLLVEGDQGAESRSTWVKIANGHCHEARPGRDTDRADAEFILAAPATTWQQLAAGKTTPVAEALAGQLRLVKGSLLKLIPYAKAATELLKAAGEAGR